MESKLASRAPVSLDVLLVEDDRDIADTLAAVLRRRGHRVTVDADGDRALEHLGERAYDLLLSDIRLPGTNGLALFDRVRHSRLPTDVILMSAFGTISEAVDAVKNSAAYYLSKPFELEQLLGALTVVEARAAARKASQPPAVADPAASIIGDTPQIVALRQFVHAVAKSDGPVLITGETGTGKELIAHTIHQLSARRSAPFVAVNCAGFPDTLLEAELFGHERGAFTGATHQRAGRFRTAHTGTLFLDEIAEMATGAQAKLLRVLENGSFQALGSDTTQHVDVRLVSATNADLQATGFRADLYYRIKMFHVDVPPLRARMGDLPMLVAHFLSQKRNGAAPELTPRAWAALTHYDFPGNVRELRSIIGHALALCGSDDIDLPHLPIELSPEVSGRELEQDGGVQTLAAAQREFERDYVTRTLDLTEWNKTQAAKLLGISRKTLWKKLRDLGLD